MKYDLYHVGFSLKSLPSQILSSSSQPSNMSTVSLDLLPAATQATSTTAATPLWEILLKQQQQQQPDGGSNDKLDGSSTYGTCHIHPFLQNRLRWRRQSWFAEENRAERPS